MFSSATWTEKDMSVSSHSMPSAVEEADEVGVGARVEHLEAGVGREGDPTHGDVDGGRVTAEPGAAS